MPLVIRRRRYGVRRPRRRVGVASVYRRVGARPAAMGALRSQITRPRLYNFKRKQFYSNAFSTVAGAAAYANAWEFALNLLPNFTDFTNLYDVYRINKVVMKIIPKITESALLSGSVNNDNLTQIHSAIDYDDNTAPTSVQQLCEYATHKMTRGSQIHTRVLVPKIEIASTSGVGQMPKAYQWIDTDTPGQLHRGVKVWVDPPVTAGTQMFYDVQLTYYISCKNVR